MRRLIVRNSEFGTTTYKYGDEDNIINYTFEYCKFNQSILYLFADNVKFIECEFSHSSKIIQRIPGTFEFINIKTNPYNQSLIVINNKAIINNSNIEKIDIHSSNIEINNSEIENSLLSYKKALTINDSNIIEAEIKSDEINSITNFSNSYVNNQYYDLILNMVKEKKF